MAARDGVPVDSRHPRVARYVGAQRINLASCDPASRASLVIDNTD
jgi:uridine kinase